MACEDVADLRPADNPAEFSRAPVFPTRECDDGRAYDERQVGVVGVALFLGAPSRAYPGAQSAAGSLNRLPSVR